MKRAIDESMDIDNDDSSSANIPIKKQTIQSNEHNKIINILEMPKEILEDILFHLDSERMLIASHVCKLFASAVETAFKRKYSNQYYEVNGYGNLLFEKVMLTKYGGQMRRIDVSNADEEILGLIEKKCLSLERVRLSSGSRMIHLKGLKRIRLSFVHYLNRQTFAEFISHNQQLEVLSLDEADFNLIELLDGQLNSLKKLTYYRDTKFKTNLPKIRLNSLETLELFPEDKVNSDRLLRALECNQLKKLELFFRGSINDVVNAICKFKTLVSIRLHFFVRIKLTHLVKLTAHLPHLSELVLETVGIKSKQLLDDILSVMLPAKLTKFTIRLDDGNDFDPLVSNIKTLTSDLHGRFAGTNAKLEIFHNVGTVFTSNDLAYVSHWTCLELLWMANLNGKNVREAIANIPHYTTDLKFINHYAGHTLDIGAFWTKIHDIKCLDIKSDGPISSEANSSRHSEFFPHLETLKIHLDTNNAIVFLEKLDHKLCERLQELWLDTKDDASQDNGCDHAYDMTNIFTKFRNLTLLNLVPAFANFDPKHVLSVCQNLKDLHIRR